MAFYRDFVTTNRPDLAAALKLFQSQDPTAGLVELAPGTYRVDKDTEFTAGQITAVQNALDTASGPTPQIVAQGWVDRMPIEDRAILLTILDQINILRTKVALATVTPVQAIQAVRDKAGTL